MGEYHAPANLSGLRMIEPGFRRTLSLRLLGLHAADVTFPPQFGSIYVVQKAGETPQITVPEEIPL